MSRLTAFFHGADTELSVFYPKGYLLAVFPTLEDAHRVMREFRNSGRGEDEMIAVSGPEAIQFAEDHLIQDGLWGAVMTGLSRMIGTEAAYTDDDLAAARNGAAFLAVHCPTEPLKDQAWSILKESNSLAARYYSGGGIELQPAHPLPDEIASIYLVDIDERDVR